MISKLNSFVKAALMGGFVVILPAVLLTQLFLWFVNFVRSQVSPFAGFVTKHFAISPGFSELLVIAAALLICFVLGVFVKIKLGNLIISTVESIFLKKIPGYSALQEIIGYFFSGSKKSAFSRPALVQPWGNETWMTGFLVEENDELGLKTVFVPTSPNPSTGLTLHIPSDKVRLIDMGSGDVLKTVIACGVGSKEFLDVIKEHGFSEK